MSLNISYWGIKRKILYINNFYSIKYFFSDLDEDMFLLSLNVCYLKFYKWRWSALYDFHITIINFAWNHVHISYEQIKLFFATLSLVSIGLIFTNWSITL